MSKNNSMEERMHSTIRDEIRERCRICKGLLALIADSEGEDKSFNYAKIIRQNFNAFK